MNIGDMVQQQINVGAPPGNGLPPRLTEKQTGVVIFVHPAARFYTVRFDFSLGSICESYFFPERERDKNASRVTEESRSEGKHFRSKKW